MHRTREAIAEGARDTIRVFIVLAAIGTVAMLAELGGGCGSGAAQSLAYDTIQIAATAVDKVDKANAAEMARTRTADVEAATSREDALLRRAPYHRVTEAVVAARAILYASERAVDATGTDGLRELAPCLVEILARLKEAVTVLIAATHVDVEIPPEVDSVLRVLAAYAGECPSAAGGES